MRLSISRRWLAAAVLGALVVVALLAAGVTQRAELPVRDLLVRGLPDRAAASVAAVLIDETALAAVGPWPWSRRELAALVRAVSDSGAAGVVVDVLLLEPRSGDEELAGALTSLPAVLVVAPNDRGTGWLAPVPALRSAGQLAHGVFELDHDGVLRRLVSTKQMGGVALPAVALAAASLVSRDVTIPVGRVLMPGFRVSPSSVPAVSATALEHGEAGPYLAGRVVFVGLAAAGLGDRVVTPVTSGLRPDPGVLVQAAVTESLLAGDLVHPISPLAAGLPAMALILAAWGLSRLGGARRLVGDVLLIAFPLGAGLAGLHLASVVLPVATLSGLSLVIVLALEVRLSLLAWSRAGTTAALLGGAGDDTTRASDGSPEARLAQIEKLATTAARRRLAEEESRRVVAHELKTPLTSVRGLSEMLRDVELSPEERRRAAGLLATEAVRLQDMIERLLELERLSLRRLDDIAIRLDLSALIAGRVELLQRGQGREVRVDLPAGLVVWGDPNLLEGVVDNLVGNAFKFSSAESVVDVRGLRRDAQVILEVVDRGRGVATEEREAIFGRFARGAGAHGVAGLGLGLALVREVVTWHRGRVEMESELGRGSTFRVMLPAAPQVEIGG